MEMWKHLQKFHFINNKKIYNVGRNHYNIYGSAVPSSTSALLKLM